MTVKEAVLLSMGKWLWLFHNPNESPKNYKACEGFLFDCSLCEIFCEEHGCEHDCPLYPKKKADRHPWSRYFCNRAYYIYLNKYKEYDERKRKSAAAHIYCILRRYAVKNGWNKEVSTIQSKYNMGV